MVQFVFDGTNLVDVFDASALGAADIGVFRDLGAGDTAIGGQGADRFALAAAGSAVAGGAGADMFFTVYDGTAAGARDTIEGGAGIDLLSITVNSSQVTDILKAELVRLQAYLTFGDVGAHFVSDILHVDMTGVETANIRLDGVLRSLSDIAPPNLTIGFESFALGSNHLLTADPAPLVENGYAFSGLGLFSTHVADTGHSLGATAGPAAGGSQFLAIYSQDAAFSRQDGADFNLLSLTVKADAVATLDAYNNGALVHSLDLTLDRQWHTLTLNWTNIDQVVVNYISNGQSNYVALDDIVVNSLVTARAPTVGFESFTLGSSHLLTADPSPLVENGYAFSGLGLFSTHVADTGHSLGATAGPAFGGSQFLAVYSQDATFGRQDGADFDLYSLAVKADAVATLDAYNNGVLVHTVNLALDRQWHTLNLNWTGIDQVVVNYISNGQSNYVALDEIFLG
ncbi:hypothetical protein ACFQS7_12015 [Dankookia sp. GCM10030260]|uniref:hypothetical protein n=1 Tax=Dankookia sp. GCM10030260 TaxID=3273390 RepID=UPI00361D54B1